MFEEFKERLLGLNDLFEEWFDGQRAFLADKGLPLEHVFTFFEERGFHPFLPVVLFTALALFAIILLLLPPPTTSLELMVFDASNSKPVQGVYARVLWEGDLIAVSSFNERFLYENLPAVSVAVELQANGYYAYSKQVDLKKTSFLAVRLNPVQALNESNKPLFELIPVPPSSTALVPPVIDYSTNTLGNTPILPASRQSAIESLELNEPKTIFGVEFTLRDVAPESIMLEAKAAGESQAKAFFITQEKGDVAGDVAFDLKSIEVNTSSALVEFVEKPAQKFGATITSPVAKSVLTSPFVFINGTASASASKGLKKAQVSIDGGKQWLDASGTNDFSFPWALPASGYYSISARAVAADDSVSAPSDAYTVFTSPCKQLYSNGDSKNKIDLVFVPSQYQEVTGFIDDVDAQLNSLYSREPFASTLAVRKKFNFYYYSYSVSCNLNQNTRLWSCDIPANVYASCPFADYLFVLVNSSLYGGTGANPAISSAGFSDLFPHELGHQVFDLADRYCCDGGYWQSDAYPNLFQDQNSCTRFAQQNYGGVCHEIGAGAWSEATNESIMQKIKYDFDTADIARINYVLEKYK